MKKYTGLHALYMCFFSKDLYRAVVREWKGLGYLYLFTLLVTVFVVLGGMLQYTVRHAVETYVYPILDDFPTMTLNGGKLAIDKPSPYYVREKKSGQAIVTFDTDDKISEVQGDAGVLVTSSQIMIKSASKSEIRELSQLPDGELTPAIMRSWCKALVDWGVPGLMAILFPCFLIMCFVQSLIYGAIGKIFTNITKSKLSYGELIRLSVVAMTPAIMLHAVCSVARIEMMGLIWNTVTFLITIGYLYFGVFANSPEESSGGSPSSIP